MSTLMFVIWMIIGNDRFCKEIELAISRRVNKLEHGGDRRSKQFNEVSGQVFKCSDPLKRDECE